MKKSKEEYKKKSTGLKITLSLISVVGIIAVSLLNNYDVIFNTSSKEDNLNRQYKYVCKVVDEENSAIENVKVTVEIQGIVGTYTESTTGDGSCTIHISENLVKDLDEFQVSFQHELFNSFSKKINKYLYQDKTDHITLQKKKGTEKTSNYKEQKNILITGHVRDAVTSKSLNGAKVTILNTNVFDITDSAGNFKLILNPSIQPVRIRIELDGYEIFERYMSNVQRQPIIIQMRKQEK